jgi:6-phosphofructokinase 1
LCPGLNNVIRSLFLELHYGYGVATVLGFRDGYSGLDPERGAEPAKITPQFVDSIHQKGGTILGTSRGPVDIGRAVAATGHSAVRTSSTRRRAAGATRSPLSAYRKPSTTTWASSRAPSDFSAPSTNPRACSTARTRSAQRSGGIGLVKLMGRHAGFITAGATIASQDVNLALIPEVPFPLEAFLAALRERILAKSHAVIAVAEGAGQDLLQTDAAERDASGNVKLKDIGLFLREGIEAYFRAQNIPVVVRYFDPSYQVRSRPANCEDAVLCDVFARHAAHAAMAGKTGLVIGFLHDRFIHVPIELLAEHTKRLDPASGWWRSVLATTGQPYRFA